jgi:transposase
VSATHSFVFLFFEKSVSMKLYLEESIDYRDKLVVEASLGGFVQSKIASMYSLHQSTVSRILKKYVANGSCLPLPHSSTASAKSALSAADDLALKAALFAGALSQGYESDYWDRKRVKELIRDKFGVEYHISHISKVLNRLNYTLQKPKRRDYRQDADQQEKWINESLPSLKKSP